jgi:hypothetical protein
MDTLRYCKYGCYLMIFLELFLAISKREIIGEGTGREQVGYRKGTGRK